MDYPKEMDLLTILKSASEPAQCRVGIKRPDGSVYWLPARSLPFWPGNPVTRLRHRLRCAWAVFTGKADVLHWR